MSEAECTDACGGSAGLQNSIHEAGVQPLDEHPDEGHLFAGVLEDHPGVVRLAAQAVGSHDHGQVVDVHLGDGDVGRLGKYLQEKRAANIFGQIPILETTSSALISGTSGAVSESEFIELSVPTETLGYKTLSSETQSFRFQTSASHLDSESQ